MEELLSKLKEELSFLDMLKAENSNGKLEITRYDLINMYILYHSISRNEDKNFIIVHPIADRKLLTLLIITAAFILYEKNLIGSADKFLENFKLGDKVKVDGCLGEFERIEENFLNQNRKHCAIKFANNLTNYFPEEDWWKIKKYEGNATKLNKYNPKNDSNKTEGVLSRLLSIDKSNIFTENTNQIMVVDNKNSAIEMIKGLKLNCVKFSEIFSSGYYSNFDNYDKVSGDPYQREPFVNITSNMFVAYDLARKKETINTLIVNGGSKINESYSELNRLKKSKYIQNIVVLLNHFYLQELNDLKELGFEPWVWTKDDIKDIYSPVIIESLSDNFYNNNFKNIYFKNENIISLKLSEECSQLRGEIFSLLKNIERKAIEGSQLNQFLRLSYSLLLHLQTVVFPFDYAKNLMKQKFDNCIFNISNVLEKMNKLINDIIGNSLRRESKPELTKVIDKFRKMERFYSEKNLKFEKLIQRISTAKNDEKIGIVLRRSSYIKIFNDILEDKGISFSNISLIIFKDLKSNKLFDELIITGWPGYRYIEPLFYNGSAKKLTFMLYTYEYNNYYLPAIKSIEGKMKKFRRKSLRMKLPMVTESLSISKEIEKKFQDNKKINFTEEITEILNNLATSVNFSDYECSNDHQESCEAYHVIFENGEYCSFLTSNFKARCLDRNNEEIVEKKVTDLQKGDELIFAVDSKRDIFEKMVIEIEKSDKKVKENIRLSNLWQKALKEYIDDKKGFSWLQTLFKEEDYEFNEMTIKNWLESDEIIGPRDHGVIDVIAKITENRDLNDNLEEVKKAITEVRSLRNKLGKYLARKIIKSVVNNSENNFEDYFEHINTDLSGYAEIVEITLLSKEVKNIDSSKVNRLIENY